MTPQQKARELVEALEKYQVSHPSDDNTGTPMSDMRSRAKQCAIICVYQLMHENTPYLPSAEMDNPRLEFLKEVKTEIEKL